MFGVQLAKFALLTIFTRGNPFETVHTCQCNGMQLCLTVITRVWTKQPY